MKKALLITLATILFVGAVHSQNRRKTPERKFVYMTSIGYASGLGQIELENKTITNKNFNISVNQLLGYQFNPYFQMGLGFGFDFWKHTAFIPVYLNLTVNFLDKRITPLLYANMGYSFKWYISSTPEAMDRVIHGTSQGPMGEAGIGMKIKINDYVSMVIAGCYKNQYTDIRYTILSPDEPDYSAYSTNSVKNVLYHFAGVRLGVLF